MTREQFKKVLKQFRENLGRGFGTFYQGLIIVDSIPDLVLEHDSIKVMRFNNQIILYWESGEKLTIRKYTTHLFNYINGYEVPFMINFSKSIDTRIISRNRSSNPEIPIYFSNESEC